MSRLTDPALILQLPTEIAFDNLLATEVNLVRSAWKGACRADFSFLPSAVYNIGMDKFIAALAQTQQLLVARATDGREEPVLGFICFKAVPENAPASVIHFVYVKKAYRAQGLAGRLLAATGHTPGRVVLSSTRWKAPRETRKKWNVYWNPFLAMPGSV